MPSFCTSPHSFCIPADQYNLQHFPLIWVPQMFLLSYLLVFSKPGFEQMHYKQDSFRVFIKLPYSFRKLPFLYSRCMNTLGMWLMYFTKLFLTIAKNGKSQCSGQFKILQKNYMYQQCSQWSISGLVSINLFFKSYIAAQIVAPWIPFLILITPPPNLKKVIIYLASLT